VKIHIVRHFRESRNPEKPPEGGNSMAVQNLIPLLFDSSVFDLITSRLARGFDTPRHDQFCFLNRWRWQEH